MTWGVTFNGHSQEGPDEQKQADYLKKVFEKVIEQISKDGVTQVTTAQLSTNAGQYDFIKKSSF